VAQALFDLEATNNELKADLRDLFINSAKEVDISSGRKAIVIHVPFRLLKAFHKVQQRLVRELEKKFSGKDVVIVANRRIMPKPTTGSSIARPRSRTLTAVHAALLEDLVYPTEIVGKRTRYRADGSKVLKVLLDPKDRCVRAAMRAVPLGARAAQSLTRVRPRDTPTATRRSTSWTASPACTAR
jgi:small subunit ribosomal protein S7e